MHVLSFPRLIITGLLFSLCACSTFTPPTLFRATSPHEQYESALKTAKLDRTALGADWVAVAQRALRDSLRITIPYRESGYFTSSKPFAVGYRINAQRGDKLIVRVNVQGQQDATVFIDVFEVDGTRTERVAFAKADTSTAQASQLVWDVRRTKTHLIRIQPELLRSGHYTLSVTREPLLSFPVQNRTNDQISSFFGADRDGGKRRHEGIDIFAPRGTPALACVNGLISGVGTNKLGGNVVWLTDTKHEQRLYYAHLDRSNVREGQQVSLGDTVGFVGNTGNARTTGPHLHFGIYEFRGGPVDPLPYVRRGLGPARQQLLSERLLGDSVRVTTAQGLVRIGPSSDAAIIRELPRSSVLTLVGGTAYWSRVELPDGLTGYITGSTTEALNRPLRRLPLVNATNLLEAAGPMAAVVETLPPNSTVEVLGMANGYQLVKGTDGKTGWIRHN